MDIKHREHIQQVKSISEQIITSKQNNNKKLRFKHGSTRSTRIKSSKKYDYINTGNLNKILEINKSKKYVIAQANVSMEKLVKETLKHNLIPPVIPELPRITVAGAVQGAALESSSFKHGQFNNTCLEYEIITGDGKTLHCSPRKNSDLFHGVSSTYGTLGAMTAVKIKLVPAKKFVLLEYFPTTSTKDTITLLRKKINENPDFIEGIIFERNIGIVITGKLTNSSRTSKQTFSKSTDPWFYKHAKKMSKTGGKILVPILDHLFRYNRGAFWGGEFFFKVIHMHSDRLTKFLFNPVLNTNNLYQILHKSNYSKQLFIQDIYVPIENAETFINETENKLNIYPLWLCPIKPTKYNEKMSPSYIKSKMLIDVGIWGNSKKYLKRPRALNLEIERIMNQLRSRKMFYASVFYSKRDFWKKYDYKWYNSLRKKYNALVFPDIYEKLEEKRNAKTNIKAGIKQIGPLYLKELFKR